MPLRLMELHNLANAAMESASSGKWNNSGNKVAAARRREILITSRLADSTSTFWDCTSSLNTFSPFKNDASRHCSTDEACNQIT